MQSLGITRQSYSYKDLFFQFVALGCIVTAYIALMVSLNMSRADTYVVKNLPYYGVAPYDRAVSGAYYDGVPVRFDSCSDKKYGDCSPNSTQFMHSQCGNIESEYWSTHEWQSQKALAKNQRKCVLQNMPQPVLVKDEKPHLGLSSVNRANQLIALTFATIVFAMSIVFLMPVGKYFANKCCGIENNLRSFVYFVAVVLTLLPFFFDTSYDYSSKKVEIKVSNDENVEARDWLQNPVMTDIFSILYLFGFVFVVYIYDCSNSHVSGNMAEQSRCQQQSLMKILDVTLAAVFQLLLWVSMTVEHHAVLETKLQYTIVVGIVCGFGFVIVQDLLAVMCGFDTQRDGKSPEARSEYDQMNRSAILITLLLVTLILIEFIQWSFTITPNLLTWLCVSILILQTTNVLIFCVTSFVMPQRKQDSQMLTTVGKLLMLVAVVVLLWLHQDQTLGSNSVKNDLINDMTALRCEKTDSTMCGYTQRLYGWWNHGEANHYLHSTQLNHEKRCLSGLLASWNCRTYAPSMFAF